jgi:hypothetical protein
VTALRTSLDLGLSLLGAAAWSFAAFVFGSRLFSPTAGGVIAFALFVSSLTWVIAGHLQDQRMERLALGKCPRCRQPIASEHRHRRWDPSRSTWLAPSTSWECRSCDYSHSESWPCPACPEAA